MQPYAASDLFGKWFLEAILDISGKFGKFVTIHDELDLQFKSLTKKHSADDAFLGIFQNFRNDDFSGQIF